jgi:hypothetical protein
MRSHCWLFGDKLRLLPNVPSMGMADNILDGIVTGLLHRLQVIKRELTADPTGVIVDKTEIEAVFTE